MKLTKTFIDQVLKGPAPNTKKIYKDDSVKGLRFIHQRSGRGTYQLRAFRGGKDFKIKIGEVGAITLDQARESAIYKLAEFNKGRSVGLVRIKERNGIPFTKVCDDYLKHGLTPESAKYYSPHINRWIKLYFEKYNIEQIDKKLVLTWFKSIESKEEANLALVTISQIFEHAKGKFIAHTMPNPTEDIRIHPETPKDQKVESSGVEPLLMAIESAPNNYWIGFLKRCLFMAVRESEILRLKQEGIESKT